MEVRCKVCDAGTLQHRKKFRMSGPVVAIGYIFLIPSILGIVVSIFMFVVSASMGPKASDAAVGISGGISIVFGVASFVGGLFGWLLIMKKNVLECNLCKATVNAS